MIAELQTRIYRPRKKEWWRKIERLVTNDYDIQSWVSEFTNEVIFARLKPIGDGRCIAIVYERLK